MDEGLPVRDREGGRTVGPAASPRSRSELTHHMAQSIRIRLKAFDHEIIDQSTRKIVETVTRTSATVRGPIPLPTDKHRYTVIRGPHIDKDSREHFEMRVHKRLIDIIDPNAKTIDSLQRIELPAGVDIEIKIKPAIVPQRLGEPTKTSRARRLVFLFESSVPHAQASDPCAIERITIRVFHHRSSGGRRRPATGDEPTFDEAANRDTPRDCRAPGRHCSWCRTGMTDADGWAVRCSGSSAQQRSPPCASRRHSESSSSNPADPVVSLDRGHRHDLAPRSSQCSRACSRWPTGEPRYGLIVTAERILPTPMRRRCDTVHVR